MSTTRIVSFGTVKSVEERFARRWLRGVGADAEFEKNSEGWYVRVEGSSAVLWGKEKPDVRVGDRIKITWEVVR